MRRSMRLTVSLLFIFCLVVHALPVSVFAGDGSTTDVSAITPESPQWDPDWRFWEAPNTATIEVWYSSTESELVYPPWYSDGPAGLYFTSLSATDREFELLPENGWILLLKDFGTQQYPVVMPYVMLYNRFSGILRFYYLAHDLGSNYTKCAVTMTTANNNIPLPATTTFLQHGSSSFLDTFSSTGAETYVGIIEQDVWCFADFHIYGYDPNPVEDSKWTFNIRPIDVTLLEGSGTLELDQFLEEATARGITSPVEMTDAVNLAVDVIGKAMNSKDLVTIVAEIIAENGPLHGTSLGDALESIISTVGSATTVDGSLEIIKEFAELAGGLGGLMSGTASSSLLQFSGGFSLTGQLTQASVFRSVHLAVPGASHTTDEYLPFYDFPLGIVNIKNPTNFEYNYSAVNVGTWDDPDYIYTVWARPSESVEYVVNPHAGIVEVEFAGLSQFGDEINGGKYYPNDEFLNRVTSGETTQMYPSPNTPAAPASEVFRSLAVRVLVYPDNKDSDINEPFVFAKTFPFGTLTRNSSLPQTGYSVPSLSGTYSSLSITSNKRLTGNLTILESLSIAEGVTLYMDPGVGIYYHGMGRMYVNGTEGNPVRMVATTPGTTHKGINIEEAGSDIEWMVIEDADTALYIRCQDNDLSHVTLQNNTYSLITGEPVYSTQTYSSLDMDNCLLQNNFKGIGLFYCRGEITNTTSRCNTGYGIILDHSYVGNPNFTDVGHFTNNLIEGNGGYGVRLDNSAKLWMGYGAVHGNNRVVNNSNHEIYLRLDDPNTQIYVGTTTSGGYNDIYDRDGGYYIVNTQTELPSGMAVSVGDPIQGISDDGSEYTVTADPPPLPDPVYREVIAQKTYWGTTAVPPAARFSGFVVYTYRLTESQALEAGSDLAPQDYEPPVPEIKLVEDKPEELISCYPNPFNPSTNVQLKLDHASVVEVEIFNTLGQVVMHQPSQPLAAGIHNYNFDASGLSTGIYFVRVTIIRDGAKPMILNSRLLMMK